MRPGREIDARIAQEVFGYEVTVVKKVLHEKAPLGVRPLLKYSKDIAAAWLVAEKMHIALLPVEGNAWFAMAGKADGWKSPAEFLEFLQEAKFVEAGAAVGQNPAETICLAALNAVDKRAASTADQDAKSNGNSTASGSVTIQ